nr:hypothetical protein GCM10020093_085530 [Planobispora longispora]
MSLRRRGTVCPCPSGQGTRSGRVPPERGATGTVSRPSCEDPAALRIGAGFPITGLDLRHVSRRLPGAPSFRLDGRMPLSGRALHAASALCILAVSSARFLAASARFPAVSARFPAVSARALAASLRALAASVRSRYPSPSIV